MLNTQPVERDSVKHVMSQQDGVKHAPNRRRPNFFGVWLSDSAKAAIDKHAEEADVGRSEMVRRMLAYAVWKMPKGWKP